MQRPFVVGTLAVHAKPAWQIVQQTKESSRPDQLPSRLQRSCLSYSTRCYACTAVVSVCEAYKTAASLSSLKCARPVQHHHKQSCCAVVMQTISLDKPRSA